MKAPNNIWLSKFEEDPGDNEYGIFEQWSLEPISNAENEEYIRKDALLKWIQEVRTIPHENAIIRDLAFQEVVNKLNSM